MRLLAPIAAVSVLLPLKRRQFSAAMLLIRAEIKSIRTKTSRHGPKTERPHHSNPTLAKTKCPNPLPWAAAAAAAALTGGGGNCERRWWRMLPVATKTSALTTSHSSPPKIASAMASSSTGGCSGCDRRQGRTKLQHLLSQLPAGATDLQVPFSSCCRVLCSYCSFLCVRLLDSMLDRWGLEPMYKG